MQVVGEAFDHLRAPALPRLSLKDVPADLPIEADEFAVYGE